MKTKIHINRQILHTNKKCNLNNPAITVKTYKSNDYANGVIIYDKDGIECARIIQSDGKKIKPLSCGARVWIETKNDVKLIYN